eukprot:scaffold66349_cov20-Prasinocladus_malaysianus.AAC.1
MGQHSSICEVRVASASSVPYDVLLAGLLSRWTMLCNELGSDEGRESRDSNVANPDELILAAPNKVAM